METDAEGDEAWIERILHDAWMLFSDTSSESVPEGEATGVAEGGTIDRSLDSDFPPRFIFTSPQEAFLTYVKVGFFVSLCISLPFLAYQIWAFVGPGLYRKEKKVVLPFMLVFPLLFTLGAAMVYYAFFPVALRFFLGFQQTGDFGQLPIVMEVRVSEYFSLLLKLLFAFRNQLPAATCHDTGRAYGPGDGRRPEGKAQVRHRRRLRGGRRDHASGPLQPARSGPAADPALRGVDLVCADNRKAKGCRRKHRCR